MLKNTDIEVMNGKLGDWCFTNDNTYILITYPYGQVLPGEPLPFDVVHLPIRKEGEERTSPIEWEWNGSIESPSLSPSILVGPRDNPYWHGYFKNGRLMDEQMKELEY